MNDLFLTIGSTILIGLIYVVTLKCFSVRPDYPHIKRLQAIKSSILVISTWLWMLIIHAPIWTSGLLIPFVLSVCYFSLTLRLHKKSKLMVIPSLFGKTGHVHLETVDASLCRGTYLELKELIELLPNCQFSELTLTSPLLAKNGRFRSTHHLAGYPIEIKMQILPGWTAPFQFLVLAWYQRVMKSPRLQMADLTKRHQLTITPKTKPQKN